MRGLIFCAMAMALCSKPSSTKVAAPTPVRLADGLEYTVLATGSGSEAKSGDKISVHYTGTLSDGTKFDSSLDRGEPFTFRLGEGQVIKGWDEGLVGMREGEKRKLVIPPELGYGSSDMGKIPPNSTLIFEVQMVEVW